MKQYDPLQEITDLQDILQCLIDTYRNGYMIEVNTRLVEIFLEESRTRFPSKINFKDGKFIGLEKPE